MKKSYDPEAARNLIPLLSSITHEILERNSRIRRGTYALEHGGRDDVRALVSELATHKRERRHALAELTRLGCRLDVGDHASVRIPGPLGTLEDGYRWTYGERSVCDNLPLLAAG